MRTSGWRASSAGATVANSSDDAIRVRERLAAADNELPGLNLSALADQNGLFAMLPLTREQIVALREDHAVYMAGSGRINIAGLHAGNTEQFIGALKAVTS